MEEPGSGKLGLDMRMCYATLESRLTRGKHVANEA